MDGLGYLPILSVLVLPAYYQEYSSLGQVSGSRIYGDCRRNRLTPYMSPSQQVKVLNVLSTSHNSRKTTQAIKNFVKMLV